MMGVLHLAINWAKASNTGEQPGLNDRNNSENQSIKRLFNE